MMHAFLRLGALLKQMNKGSESDEFYREAIELLTSANVPFLVGGAYAFCIYTGISRHTKDIDLFLRERDLDAALDVFRTRGYETERTFPHWLAKVKCGGDCIDLIYRAGNGLCEVDDSWFARARAEEVFGRPVALVAPEEIIWMKAYIMERERYDGADVAHLIESCAEKLDWPHLLRRFGADWRVLLGHLVLFGFVYPSEKRRVPENVVHDLLDRAREDQRTTSNERICRGTLLSREQYLADVQERGYRDARLEDGSAMTAADVKHWTEAIERDKQ